MDKYNEFRLQYPDFYYHGFDVVDNGDHIFVTYDFEIKGLMRFNPTLKVPKTVSNYDKSLLNKMIFSLGLCEIPSYWKPTCSKNIIIECGKLDDLQIAWVKKLMLNGLGEFFYTNGITPEKDFVNITSKGESYPFTDNNNYDGYLIAVGGGKDSIVSLEILKNEENRHAFIMNNRKVCFDCAEIAGVKDIINPERLFDKNIIELNNRGFLNGHTPISSCIAFVAYISAYLNGLKYIVLSNESSSNEASVKGTNINHQYSKSFEFENDFRWYVDNYLTNKIEYFSLLRPLNELEIMKIFTKYPKYFKHFISCNNGGKRKNIGKTDGWCLSCPKCLFIYIIMSYFVDEETMIDVFGANMLDDKGMLNYFLELLGKTDNKPFECVGTIEEVKYVVNGLILRGYDKPYLLDYYKKHFKIEQMDDSILTKLNDKHNVNDYLFNLLKEEFYNDKQYHR